MFLPTSIKNHTINEIFVHTPKIPFNNSSSTGKTNSGDVLVERDESKSNAFFLDGGYKTVKDVVTRLYVAVAKCTRLIVTSSTEKDSVEFNSAEGYGLNLHDRSLFDVLGSNGCRILTELGIFT